MIEGPSSKHVANVAWKFQLRCIACCQLVIIIFCIIDIFGILKLTHFWNVYFTVNIVMTFLILGSYIVICIKPYGIFEEKPTEEKPTEDRLINPL